MSQTSKNSFVDESRSQHATVMRTHRCGEVTNSLLERTVAVCGWVRRRRDHGGLIFIDLCDTSGLLQLVCQPEYAEVFALAESLRSEFVIAAEGSVRSRPEGTANEELSTGLVEVEITQLKILSESETPPFVIADEVEAKEELRLEYRFLDLRRSPMQERIKLRHQVYSATRDYLNGLSFTEVETPILTKPTPEGARDFLVPSRLSQREFYALPQSPQLFKQVLMCAAFDRYYQIVRCFRDEDLRANRQPEFTQIDIEMSFVEENDVIKIAEGLIAAIWARCTGQNLELPLPRMSYRDAMECYGVDAPDLRFELELVDLAKVFSDSQFAAFRSVVDTGGRVKGIRVPDAASFSRKDLDNYTQFVRQYGAKGLAWVKFDESGELKSAILKFLTEEQQALLKKEAGLQSGDILFLVADKEATVFASLGALRSRLAKDLQLIDDSSGSNWQFTWVERFPLFDYDANAGRYVSTHHPFTAPLGGLPESKAEYSTVEARAYDLVLNGQEIGGGSIRIHESELQSKIFSALNIDEDEAREKFGFLLDALSFGAPPHGGIAFGLDRILMLLSNTDSIRDVIAFPKTQKGQDLMVGAPSPASSEQLVELGIRLAPKANS